MCFGAPHCVLIVTQNHSDNLAWATHTWCMRLMETGPLLWISPLWISALSALISQIWLSALLSSALGSLDLEIYSAYLPQANR